MFAPRIKIAAVIVGVVIVLFAGASALLLGGGRVYPGVRLAGADLSNMTPDQASERISLLASEAGSRRFDLRYAGESLAVSVAELGGTVNVRAAAESAYGYGRQGSLLRRLGEVIAARRAPVDLPMKYDFDESAASDFLRASAPKINRDPQDARPVSSDGSVVIRPEKLGIRLKVEESIPLVAAAVNSGRREADLVVETSAPKVKASDLEGIDGVLGSYSTPYNSWERDRSHNLRVACRALDGTIVKPGGDFSYNQVVGPRDRKSGFRDAKMFVEGRIESGTGGGVCQVSTTVYNAALLSNLKILRRSHHSRPVVYAPVGRDATVAPNIDLKFRNDTDAPIFISASVGEKTVNVTIFGRRHDGRKVEIVSEGHSVFSARTVRQVDDGLEPGKTVVTQPGRAGHRISIYRVVREGGGIVSRELVSRDVYAPEARVIRVSGGEETRPSGPPS